MFKEAKKSPQENTGISNRILGTTLIKGDVTSESDFRVDGRLEGTVKTTGKVVIGKSGSIIGKIECASADIEGSFNGILLAKELLSLKSSAVIEGEVTATKLSIETGAVLNATCQMKNGHKIMTGETSAEKK